MKKVFAFILIGVLAISVSACTKNKKSEEPITSVIESSQTQTSEGTVIESGMAVANDEKSILLPENATILTEDNESVFIEVDMVYEDVVKFYEEAVETLDATGEVSDMDSEEDLWAFTGTYGKEDESLFIMSP